jgi:cytochrome d ubiquinol oxidase subunit I
VLLSCYVATAFAVAWIHAARLRQPGAARLHRHALGLALMVGGSAVVLQMVSGHFSASRVHAQQPVKLAALEGQFETQRGAPLRIGGWPDPDAGRTRWALEIPRGLSLLAAHDPSAEIAGLAAFPRGEWPPVRAVHVSFQVMVGSGLLLAATAAAALGLAWRGRWTLPVGRRFLRWTMLVAPLGFVAMEAGWMVTELGRQPWIVHQVMRTAEAVTPTRGMALSFWAVTGVYLVLAVATAVLLRRQIVPRRAAETGG